MEPLRENVRDQRMLLIIPGRGCDACCFANYRLSAVRSDDEPCMQRHACLSADLAPKLTMVAHDFRIDHSRWRNNLDGLLLQSAPQRSSHDPVGYDEPQGSKALFFG